MLDQSATYHMGLGDCLYQKLSLAIQPCLFGDRVLSVERRRCAVYRESVDVEKTDGQTTMTDLFHT